MADRPWRDEWERQAGAWADLTTDDPFYDLLNKPTFLELLPAPGRLTLDVGCGEGHLARELTSIGHTVVGVDGSGTLAGLAAQAGTTVAIADSTALPVASGVADLVVCFMVLMDVEDLDHSVAELARVLAPGGVLCAAILHPILTSGLFVPDDPHRTFFMGEYRTAMRHVLDVERMNGETFRFRVEHRPLEDYSRAFETAGLAISALREPRPGDDVVSERPEFANYQRVPNFLHVRARRIDGGAVC